MPTIVQNPLYVLFLILECYRSVLFSQHFPQGTEAELENKLVQGFFFLLNW